MTPTAKPMTEEQYQDYLKGLREANLACLVESLPTLGVAIAEWRQALGAGDGPRIMRASQNLAYQSESVRFHLGEHIKGEPK